MSSNFVFSSISGGYFVSQTAILANILDNATTGIDCYMGNSGGAIANLIALKHNRTKESMEKILYSIDRDMFIQPWVSSNVPFSPIMDKFFSLIKSSFYKSGKGNQEIVDTFFTTRELNDAEFWIGKYDISANFMSLLCSKTSGQSIFSPYINSAQQKTYIEDITGTYVVKYAAGDKKKIADTLSATSAIPGYKPPVVIDGIPYVDGGVASPTPASSMINMLKQYGLAQIANNANHRVHFFYNIGPKQVDKDVEYMKPGTHWSVQISRTLKSVLNFSIYKERQLLFDTWVQLTGNDYYNENGNINHTTVSGGAALKTFLANNDDKHYFVTCYTKDKSINIVKFDKQELKETFEDCYNNAFFEIYYTT